MSVIYIQIIVAGLYLLGLLGYLSGNVPKYPIKGMELVMCIIFVPVLLRSLTMGFPTQGFPTNRYLFGHFLFDMSQTALSWVFVKVKCVCVWVN